MKGIPGFVVHLEVRRHRLQDVHHITPHSLQGETTPKGELHTNIQGSSDCFDEKKLKTSLMIYVLKVLIPEQ